MSDKPRSFKIYFLIFLVPLAMMVWTSPSTGQGYPTKTIELISPYPPGGQGPLVATLIAEEAKKYLSQPVIVVYKPGAGGTIGAYYVAKAPADGYTLMLTSVPAISISHLNLGFQFSPLDYELIAGVVAGPLIMVVRPDAPWKTLKDLVNFAKQNPGAVTCGVSGVGSSTYLNVHYFAKTTGIKLTYVPFKGGPESVTALAGGHVMIATMSPGESQAMIDAGKVKLFSVLDSKRNKFYPDIPTSVEEGYGTAGLRSWRAVMAPKGTPKNILVLWENFLKKICQDRSFVEKGQKLKLDIEFLSGEELQKHTAKEMQIYRELSKELDIKPM